MILGLKGLEGSFLILLNKGGKFSYGVFKNIFIGNLIKSYRLHKKIIFSQIAFFKF